MSGVAIYMEGGGAGRDSKAALRQGMDAFLDPLKQAAREKKLHWKLVCCGPRDEAFRGFRNALRDGDDDMVVLLVDDRRGLIETVFIIDHDDFETDRAGRRRFRIDRGVGIGDGDDAKRALGAPRRPVRLTTRFATRRHTLALFMARPRRAERAR